MIVYRTTQTHAHKLHSTPKPPTAPKCLALAKHWLMAQFCLFDFPVEKIASWVWFMRQWKKKNLGEFATKRRLANNPCIENTLWWHHLPFTPKTTSLAGKRILTAARPDKTTPLLQVGLQNDLTWQIVFAALNTMRLQVALKGNEMYLWVWNRTVAPHQHKHHPQSS